MTLFYTDKSRPKFSDDSSRNINNHVRVLLTSLSLDQEYNTPNHNRQRDQPDKTNLHPNHGILRDIQIIIRRTYSIRVNRIFIIRQATEHFCNHTEVRTVQSGFS